LRAQVRLTRCTAWGDRCRDATSNVTSRLSLRDSGTRSPRDEGYLGAELRWTVSGNESSLAIIESGLAYAWLPASVALPALDAGKLKMLPLESGANRKVPLYVYRCEARTPDRLPGRCAVAARILAQRRWQSNVNASCADDRGRRY